MILFLIIVFLALERDDIFPAARNTSFSPRHRKARHPSGFLEGWG